MSEQTTPPAAVTPPPDEHQRVETLAEEAGRPASTFARVMQSSVGRNLGLVIALLILVIVGVVTAGDNFASTDNVLTILRLASVIHSCSIRPRSSPSRLSTRRSASRARDSLGSVIACSANCSTVVAINIHSFIENQFTNRDCHLKVASRHSLIA